MIFSTMFLQSILYYLAISACGSKADTNKVQPDFIKISHETYANAMNPTMSPSLEIGDSYYVYITKTEDLLDIVDQLSSALKDLNVDLKKWFMWQIQPVGYVVKLPLIKGLENQYKPILDRYGISNLKLETVIRGQGPEVMDISDIAGRKVYAPTLSTVIHPSVTPFLQRYEIPQKIGISTDAPRMIVSHDTSVPVSSIQRKFGNEPELIDTTISRPAEPPSSHSHPTSQLLFDRGTFYNNGIKIPTIQTISPSINYNIVSSINKPETLIEDASMFKSEEGSLESDPQHVYAEKVISPEDDELPMEPLEKSHTLPEWFLVDPAYNMPRYSVIDLYLMFPHIAELIEYCTKLCNTCSAPNVKDLEISPYDWVETLRTAEKDLYDIQGDIQASLTANTVKRVYKVANINDGYTNEEYSSEERSFI